MPTRRCWIFCLSAVPLALLLAQLAVSAAPPAAQRAILATISVDGEVVLKASTGDDGSPDADAVWNYLRGDLVFRPTEAFRKLDVSRSREPVTLGWLKSRDNAHLGEPPALRLFVSNGGTDTPFRLELIPSADGETWRVAPDTVERRFRHRFIRRAEAARLDDPTRVK